VTRTIWHFKNPVEQTQTLGILLWLVMTALALMTNPLPWQRYYVPLIPVVTLYAALGTVWICEQIRTRSVLAGNRIVGKTDK
jgi:hypothetical protein